MIILNIFVSSLTGRRYFFTPVTCCHSEERSDEKSQKEEILRFAQDDKNLNPYNNPSRGE